MQILHHLLQSFIITRYISAKKVSFFCSKHFLLPGTLVEKKKKKAKTDFQFFDS